MKRFITAGILLINLIANAQQEDIQVAFLADVHLQDLYGSFEDNEYKGIINPVNNKYVLMRTMEAQLHSTRIFNENYFAFIAALNDIAKRGVKIVALPGDYTDDGQPIHLRGLQKILKSYADKYGIQFFITTGNHDPVAPWDKAAGKKDFLGVGGKNQPIFSSEETYKNKTQNTLPAIITKDIATMGYESISTYLKDFGFYPSEKSVFWTTPYSTYSYEDYTYQKALNECDYSTRSYEVTPGYTIPDASYLTEPVNGLWLLAIDGNVYLPKKTTDSNAANPANYSGASIGYNNVLTNKKHLIKWVQKIAAEAKRLDKTLVAFSHYPAVEFNDGASGDIEALLGKGKWQMERVPHENVAQFFADAGVQLHFAGHMHINDTGIYKSAGGNTLFNIQSPSLAAYIPAYKLLTIHSKQQMDIETITLNDVPRFNELFELYKTELNYLKKNGQEDIWDEKILETKNYHDFMLFHLKELVRLRLVPSEWPSGFVKNFSAQNGYELLIAASGSERAALKLLKKVKFNKKTLEKWNGMDWITDLYKLQSADCLALTDIGAQRLNEYKIIIDTAKANANTSEVYLLFYSIFSKLQHGDPAGNFSINLETGTIIKNK